MRMPQDTYVEMSLNRAAGGSISYTPRWGCCDFTAHPICEIIGARHGTPDGMHTPASGVAAYRMRDAAMANACTVKCETFHPPATDECRIPANEVKWE